MSVANHVQDTVLSIRKRAVRNLVFYAETGGGQTHKSRKPWGTSGCCGSQGIEASCACARGGDYSIRGGGGKREAGK